MIISVSTNREYVPKFNGNDKLPKADQFKVMHKAPTISIKESLFPRKFDFNAAGEVTSSFEIDRKKILNAFITDIQNLSYSVDGDDKKVTNTRQLFDAPVEFDTLIEELYGYFNELLNKKVDEKN